jgi:hypothetical protein
LKRYSVFGDQYSVIGKFLLHRLCLPKL